MGWFSRDWCCSQLRSGFQVRQWRGPFIFVSPPYPPVTESYSFWLAFRAIDANKSESLQSDPGLVNVDIRLSTSQAIFHCPWCGCRLARFYGKGAARLVDGALCVEFKIPGWEHLADPTT
jgi:hypothetical protein